MSRDIAMTPVLAGQGLALAGCGYRTRDRAASGGLLGAGAGAGIAAVTGGSTLTGALGGAASAVGGAVTSHNDIDLGCPIWR